MNHPTDDAIMAAARVAGIRPPWTRENPNPLAASDEALAVRAQLRTALANGAALGVGAAVAYCQTLPKPSERKYANGVYAAMMRDRELPERPPSMTQARAADIRETIGGCLPERRDPPRDELMCMYPSRCWGTCVKQFEDGYACNH